MSDFISIQRLEALPSELAPSTIYIIKSQVDFVDLYFTNSTGKEIRRVLNVLDIQTELNKILDTWVPELARKTEKTNTPFNIQLIGDATGVGYFNGKDDVVIEVTAQSSGTPDDGDKVWRFDLFDDIQEEWFSGYSSEYPIALVEPDPALSDNTSDIQFQPNKQYIISGEFAAALYTKSEQEMKHNNWKVRGVIITDRNGDIAGWNFEAPSQEYSGRAGNHPWTIGLECVPAFYPDAEDIANGLTHYPSVARFVLSSVDDRPADLYNSVRVVGHVEIEIFDSYRRPE